MKEREIKSTIITLFLVSIFLFALIYFIHTKNIENRFDKTLENYTTHLQSIATNNVVINLDTKILESSMSEIMKNSNDLLSFWFAFLSVIMIVFTFAGIFINNNILSDSKDNLNDIEKLKEKIETYKEKIQHYELDIENLQLKIDTETQRKIFKLETSSNKFLKEINEKNSEALNSIDKLKIEFNNSINLIQEKSNQMILDIKEQAQTESKQLIESIKDKAEEETKKLIEENNRNIEISNLLNSAYQAYNNKEYDTSINYYNKIIKMTDNLLNGYDKNSEEYSKYKNICSMAYNNRGTAKKDLGLYEEAIEDYDKAIELNPNYPDTHYNIGIAKSNLGLYEEAIKDFNKAIGLNPNYSKAYNNRGNARSNLKQYKEAIEDYDKAIELNANYSNTYDNMRLSKTDLGLYEEAIKEYDKDIELNTNYSKYYFNRALPKQLLANITENEREKNKLVEEAYNDFIKSYKLADDKLKDNYKQKAINFAKQGYEAYKKICDKMYWEY
ncbi:tetratricopeptide repeat protein [Brachyspira pilosicoli]|uniref:tetratricopeptide repeat protein n=1 Tax=Brachyspira pilosicoli TaxID=52584 RepID=UPI00255C3C37|nr:tetratricopeptide repeat protein [Brachyspira pilosicoli]